MARRHGLCPGEDRLDTIVGGSYAPLDAFVLVEDNGLTDKVRMPHTDRKQIRRQVEDDTIAGATDSAAGSCKIDRQRLTISEIIQILIGDRKIPVDAAGAGARGIIQQRREGRREIGLPDPERALRS